MGKKTTFDAGFITRAARGVRYMFTGDWFGAGTPPAPIAPESVRGRQHDFPAFINTAGNKPRQNDPISFEQLRALADNYDLLRMIIERRKDQIAKLDWTIQRRDLAGTHHNESSDKDRRVDEIVAFFRQPDKEHTWDDWLRMLLEDLLVIDAPCIYPRYTKGGSLYALEPMDGATIKRVLDDTGRTPIPPQTAYQQILKGMAAIDYSRDELLYRPRNPRTFKVYGYSPVEQVITTVNIALRRQMHQLEYYRSGSVPDALIGVPDTWGVEEIRRFQEYWDLLLSGELAERRKMKFLPGDLARNFVETKQTPLKDEYDEWLARVVCFCFSIEPTPFVKQQNRAVADTAREQSLSEGLVPLQKWVKSLIDDVLARFLDAPEYEFIWDDEDSIDPKAQADINCQYVAAGILTADEVRAELGRAPLPETQPETPEKDATKEVDAEDGANEDDEETAGKIAKKHKPAADEAQATRIITRFLQQQAGELAKQVVTLGAVFRKEESADKKTSLGDWILEQLSFAAWSALAVAMLPTLRRVAAASGIRALAEIGDADGGKRKILRSLAAQWAQERAAAMVGMRLIDGKWLPNPNAEWQITESTRQMLRQMVTDAIENGLSHEMLAAQMREHFAFSAARARMIARTEIGNADMAGKVLGWKQSGVVMGKRWVTVGDDKVSPPCVECAAVGAIALDDAFPSGKQHPLNHPNCRCDVSPVMIGEPLGKAFNPNQRRVPKGNTSGGRWVGVNLATLTQAAIDNPESKELHEIGLITQSNIEAVRENTGLDFTGYRRYAHDDELRHLVRSHGEAAKEEARGQRGVTLDDITLIPSIIRKPDYVVKSDKKWQRIPVVEYRKQIGKDEYVYIEAYNTKKATLRYVSLRIHRKK
ncbi:MAG: phage portal protein [Neisseria sp.]|nr:phage portal protein [Neisseria sp.]